MRPGACSRATSRTPSPGRRWQRSRLGVARSRSRRTSFACASMGRPLSIPLARPHSSCSCKSASLATTFVAPPRRSSGSPSSRPGLMIPALLPSPSWRPAGCGPRSGTSGPRRTSRRRSELYRARPAARGREVTTRAGQEHRSARSRSSGRRGTSRTRDVRAYWRERRRGRGGRPAAPDGLGRARVAQALRGADQARDGGAVPARCRMLKCGDRRAPRTSAGARLSTTWPTSCPSSTCAAARRRPPTRRGSPRKTRSEIGSPADAAGAARRDPLAIRQSARGGRP